MKYIINIKDISTYRSQLMGWAILWIMMLHFTFNQIKPLGFIAQYGFAGVEIFIFVSGFGLFFTLDKNNSTIHFYSKRLLRIYPTYYILGILASLILFHDSILDYLFRYTTIGFWTNSIFWEWYIPSLIALYIIAPLLKYAINKGWFFLLGLITMFCLVLSYLLIDKENILNREHFFLLYRIPAFIFGMICAYWMKKDMSGKYFIYILLAGVPFFVLLFPLHHQIYNYKYFSLIFLLPTFLLFFLTISKYLKIFNTIMSLIGNASLEIYLIQCIVFSSILRGLLTISAAWHDLATIALIILCTLWGIIFHWVIDKSGIYRLL